MTLPTDGTVLEGWGEPQPPVKNPTIEQRIYAVARWAADLQITEMRDGPEHAMLLRDAGPGPYVPSEADWERVNETSWMGINYVLHGNVDGTNGGPLGDYAEVYYGSGDLWYYRVKARNHEIVDGSEGYASKSNAKRALARRYPGIEVREP